MTAVLAHRGPDGDGFAHWGQAALGHRRLAIVDVEGGHQPMSNEDGRITVVFNGEIYNAPRLRQELQARGHRLATRCDTEVLVHLYEEKGPELVHELCGMFAFALWDEGRGRGLLARDRLGIKPLFYSVEDGTLLFGSELKALLSEPGRKPEIDPHALDAYLALHYVPAPRTIFRGIRKLSPGELLEIDGGKVTLRRWWSPPTVSAGGGNEPANDAAAAEALRELLERVVEDHLMSDVPVGVFLSGGVDSSVVAALAARKLDEPLRTFTIRFEEAAFDEGPAARTVAEHLGARHQERTVRMDALAVLPELVRCYDEPFGDSSAIPTYYLAREAARDVKACLSGDGGDESFAGYDRYPRQLELRRLDRWPRSLRRFASGMATRVLPEHVPGYGLLSQLGDTPLERYQRQVGCFDGSSRERLLLPAWHEALAPNGSFFERDWAEESDPLAQMQRLDLATYLPDDILTKVDRASMAHSLEVRVPLVDHRVVEAAAALPSSLKLRGREKKWILRRVARDLLPPGVVDRPKRGFEVPLVEWLRGPLGEHAQRVLLGARARERGILACDAVERLLRLHGRGGRDFSPRIYSLLFLEEWCRVHLDGAAP